MDSGWCDKHARSYDLERLEGGVIPRDVAAKLPQLVSVDVCVGLRLVKFDDEPGERHILVDHPIPPISTGASLAVTFTKVLLLYLAALL